MVFVLIVFFTLNRAFDLRTLIQKKIQLYRVNGLTDEGPFNGRNTTLIFSCDFPGEDILKEMKEQFLHSEFASDKMKYRSERNARERLLRERFEKRKEEIRKLCEEKGPTSIIVSGSSRKNFFRCNEEVNNPCQISNDLSLKYRNAICQEDFDAFSAEEKERECFDGTLQPEALYCYYSVLETDSVCDEVTKIVVSLTESMNFSWKEL